jgi:D-alanyl-D-alanine carboxypeptidase
LLLWLVVSVSVPPGARLAQAASGTAGQETAAAPASNKAPKAKTSKKSAAAKQKDPKASAGKAASTQQGKGKVAASSGSGASSVRGQKGQPASKAGSSSATSPRTTAKKKARTRQATAPVERYKAALVMDARTGEILYQENSHRKLVPASLTKMMLTLVAMERIRSGERRLNELVIANEQTTAVGGTQIGLQPGESLLLEDLLQAVIIRSANDAAAAVAEHLGGSQERFVAMMNAHAVKLGMADTRFHNVHGLPERDGEDNVSTAYDMALLAKELLKYPQVLEWSSKEFAVIRDGQYIIQSTNKLLGTCEGVDGLKTGFIRKAGFNIAATAKRDDTRIIAVVLGSPSSKVRNSAARSLLTIGFEQSHGREAHANKAQSNPA